MPLESWTADSNPWAGVELGHFVTLATVARERSVRGAAVALGCAQTTIARHIARIERTVGAHLFDGARGAEPVALTEVGVALAGHAERVVAQLEAARDEMRALDAPHVT
jgi:DNA-binding transcriptional LysR family regulator